MLAPEMTPAAAEPPMRALVEELGLSAGQVFGILRTAVTGQKVSPPLFESKEIIGKAEVIRRMKAGNFIVRAGWLSRHLPPSVEFPVVK